jgi:hypothetical protein
MHQRFMTRENYDSLVLDVFASRFLFFPNPDHQLLRGSTTLIPCQSDEPETVPGDEVRPIWMDFPEVINS